MELRHNKSFVLVMKVKKNCKDDGLMIDLKGPGNWSWS